MCLFSAAFPFTCCSHTCNKKYMLRFCLVLLPLLKKCHLAAWFASVYLPFCRQIANNKNSFSSQQHTIGFKFSMADRGNFPTNSGNFFLFFIVPNTWQRANFLNKYKVLFLPIKKLFFCFYAERVFYIFCIVWLHFLVHYVPNL